MRLPRDEASIGKALRREMGVRPWRETQPDFPPELVGITMSTYYGGRSEVHIRRQIVRVLYCDFVSMYPTVCTLMGLWRYVIAEGIEQRFAPVVFPTPLNRKLLEGTERGREFLIRTPMKGSGKWRNWPARRYFLRRTPPAL
jgi:hypothetical protein